MNLSHAERVRRLLIERGCEDIGRGEVRFRCPAPGHNDPGPSAHWNERKGCWSCRGCHATGTTAGLLVLLEGTFRVWPERQGRAPEVGRFRASGGDERRIGELVRRIWHETVAAQGTVIEKYLRSRGIEVPLPPALQYHPRLWHVESGRAFPAMVAGVQNSDGALVAIHRTWLQADGNGKAEVDNNKKLLGPVNGAAVRLADCAGDLMVGEGIETVLSAIQLFGRPGWAATTSGHLRQLVLPDEVRTVTILVDGDAAGEKAAEAAAALWRSQGRQADLKRAPTAQDWNDVLRTTMP